MIKGLSNTPRLRSHDLKQSCGLISRKVLWKIPAGKTADKVSPSQTTLKLA
jgi:hypothetical protein